MGGADDQASPEEGINDHASTVYGGLGLVTPDVVEGGEGGIETSYDDQLVGGGDDQPPTMRGMTDHASTSKGGLGLVTPLVEDGWEERGSDEDDFIKLTQCYVGGGWSHQDDPEISIPIAVKKTPAVMEDDLDEKEDDRNLLPSLKDDQNRLVTLEERLVSQ